MLHCEVIQDLLPLYLDDCCSKESRQLVEEHLKECDRCRTLMKQMGQELTIEEKEIEENLEEEQLLRKSKEELKKEVKIDYLEKAVRIDAFLNIMIMLFLISQSVETAKEGLYFRLISLDYEVYGGEGMISLGAFGIFLIFDVVFLRSSRREGVGFITWAVAGMSVLFKIGILILCGVVGITLWMMH